MANRRWASGESVAPAASRASKVPSGMTTRPGRNLRVAGFGVASVWMNIGLVLSSRFKAGRGCGRALARIPWMWRFRRAFPSVADSAREGVDLVVREGAGHDDDRDRERGGGLAGDGADERPRPLLRRD